MARISKSKLDIWDTRQETSLRKLAEDAFDQVSFDGLTDVDVLNPDDNDTIFYSFTANLWENHPLKTINGESLKGPGDILVGGGGGSGTVTSVGLSAPSQFTVSGSPVTTSGTLGFAWNNQVANRVLAGPTTGADAAPTFRALVVDDIPGLPPDQIRNFTPERLLGWGGVVTGGGNGTLITTGTGFVWSGDQLDLSTNLQGWSGVATSAKQDTITPGTGLSFSGATLNLSANLQSWSGISPSSKQDTLTAGTNITIVGTTISATGGGGLTHFTESVNTSAPNATTPVVQLLATNAATNVDVALTAKGTGSISAQVADGTTAGGNKRGSGSFDFQTLRSNAAQVASGTNCVLVGGSNNTATGTGTAVISGTGNTASSSNSAVVTGNGNTASGTGSFVGGGSSNTASGTNAGVICGASNQATATRSFVGGGLENQATGESSWIPGGVQASTRGLFSAYAWSGARRSTNYDNQCIGITVQGSTSNATPAILTAQRGAASTSNVMVLPNNSCWTGTVHITGRSSGGDVYYLRLDVVGARGASAATTTVKATNPAYTFTDTALVGVSATVVANTTRGSLEVEVTGLAATTIDWFAHFDAGNQIVR